MGRGITIDTKNTYTDWDLILKSQDIGIPVVKTNFVSIPAGDGSIDLTEALTGYPTYENREGEFSFDVLCMPSERPALIEQIGSYIHGIKRKIVLPDDPDYYYLGRLEIDSFKTAGMVAELNIRTISEPYKYKTNKTVVDGTIGVSGELALVCENSRKRVIPTLTVSGAVTLEFGTASYSLEAGIHILTNLILVEGDNTLTFTGAEGVTVNVEYQEGAI